MIVMIQEEKENEFRDCTEWIFTPHEYMAFDLAAAEV